MEGIPGALPLDPQLTPEDETRLQQLLFAADVLPCERKRYFALWHAHQGLSSYKIADMGIMTATRVRRVITLYREGGLDALKERIHPGRQSQITPEIGEDLKRLVLRDDRVWTAKTLGEYLAQTYDIHLKVTAITNQLHKLGLTWQRTRYVVAGQADPEEKAKFKENLELVKRGPSSVS